MLLDSFRSNEPTFLAVHYRACFTGPQISQHLDSLAPLANGLGGRVASQTGKSFHGRHPVQWLPNRVGQEDDFALLARSWFSSEAKLQLN